YRPRVLPREHCGLHVDLRVHAPRPPPRGVTAAVSLPLTLGITGASGAVYAVGLLRALNDAAVPVRLIVSSTGWRLLSEELDIDGEAALRERTGDWSRVVLYADDDRGATPASGS